MGRAFWSVVTARRSVVAVLAAVALIAPWNSAALAQPAGSAVVRGSAKLSLGVGGHLVAGAWNPVRLELRDVGSATLSIDIDQGSLRVGEVPLRVTFDVRAGAGLTLFEELVYVPAFTRLSWRLTSSGRVLGSGSIASREVDERPLDLLLSDSPGSYQGAFAAAFGGSPRLVSVAGGELPDDPAAYDGVRSILVDGTVAAPDLAPLVAAVSGGVRLALLGPLPASHRSVELLVPERGIVRVGGGLALASTGEPFGVVQELATPRTVDGLELVAALATDPLVGPERSLPVSVVFLALALLGSASAALVAWGGPPGVVAALGLAALTSAVAWVVTRPAAAQHEASVTVAVSADGVALTSTIYELFTLPRTEWTVPSGARPLRVQPYSVDESGTHLRLGAWRSVMLQPVPRVVTAPMSVLAEWLVTDGELAPTARGGEASGPAAEIGAASGRAQYLAPLLPDGSLVAMTGCLPDCVYWVALPEPERSSISNTSQSIRQLPQTAPSDPFRPASAHAPGTAAAPGSDPGSSLDDEPGGSPGTSVRQ